MISKASDCISEQIQGDGQKKLKQNRQTDRLSQRVSGKLVPIFLSSNYLDCGEAASSSHCYFVQIHAVNSMDGAVMDHSRQK